MIWKYRGLRDWSLIRQTSQGQFEAINPNSIGYPEGGKVKHDEGLQFVQEHFVAIEFRLLFISPFAKKLL